MKSSKFMGLLASLFALSSGAVFGSVSITTAFGVCRDGASAPVAAGTLWALIVDNGNLSLPQMNAVTDGNTSNIATSSVGNPSPFWYQTLSIGLALGGDTVVAMGGFGDATGVQGDTISLLYGALSPNGSVLAGRAFGFYWFPGVTYTAPGTYPIAQGAGNYVGGVVSLAPDEPGQTLAMYIPPDGNDINAGAVDPTVNGAGGVPAANFLPTLIIPEPSSMLLGALGALGLLRRRR